MARKLSPGTHTIRIKKPGGGTRMQRVNVLKSGKFKFIKNVKGAAKPKPAKAKPRGKKARTSPGRRKTMARRKMSLPNRIINGALFALSFARPLAIMLGGGNFEQKARTIVSEATGGVIAISGAKGKFDTGTALRFYGPAVAAFALFEVKKMAMQKFRF